MEIGEDVEITNKFESSQEYGYTTILLLIITYYLYYHHNIISSYIVKNKKSAIRFILAEASLVLSK
jgi:hypothetical protein